MASNMCIYWNLLRRGNGHVLRRALEFKDEGEN